MALVVDLSLCKDTGTIILKQAQIKKRCYKEVIILLGTFILKIEQKGMTFDHDFGYYFPHFSSLLKKKEEEKENELAKIVIKGHAFLLDLFSNSIYQTLLPWFCKQRYLITFYFEYYC